MPLVASDAFPSAIMIHSIISYKCSLYRVFTSATRLSVGRVSSRISMYYSSIPNTNTGLGAVSTTGLAQLLFVPVETFSNSRIITSLDLLTEYPLHIANARLVDASRWEFKIETKVRYRRQTLD